LPVEQPARPLEELRQRERVVHDEALHRPTLLPRCPGASGRCSAPTIEARFAPVKRRALAGFTAARTLGYRVAMNSRWDDAAADGLSDLDLLVYASRLIGAETSLVVWGGGNTSIKRVERDHRGREARVLRVKGSGSDLKSIQKKDFP